MKALILLVGVICYAAFAGWASADARIELGDDVPACHFPRSNADTDDEDKLTCAGTLVENANGGAIAGYALVEKIVPPDFVPYDTQTTGLDSNTNCTLQNDDGTEYQVADWEVNISGECKLQRRILTTNGVIYTDMPDTVRRFGDARMESMGISETCYSRHEIICGTGEDAEITEAEEEE